MCNLYSMTSNQEAIRAFARFYADLTGNLAPMPGIFPDYPAPIVRNAPAGRELALARWGMPSSPFALMEATKKRAAKLEADNGTTNIRNTTSKHWQRWLGPENRCVVPFTSFSEFNKEEGGDIWFALAERRPLAFFAGICVPQWTSVREVKTGLETIDLFGFLTSEPNAEFGAVQPKAMPVLLRTPADVEAWLSAPTPEALAL